MKTYILLATLFVSSVSFAGARYNLIECSNGDKSFELKGSIPGGIYDLDLDIKSKGLFEGRLYDEYNEKSNKMEGNASIEQFDASEDGVFAITLTKKVEGFGTVGEPKVSISLHGIPATFKKGTEGRDTIVKFSAKVDTYIYPNEKLTSSSKMSRVTCKLTYPAI